MRTSRIFLCIGILLLAACNSANPVACTMEAKQCSDGSYVTRSGPSCDFAACPGDTASSSSVSLQSVSDSVITVSYPPEFALATSSGGLLVHSYIPACDEGFGYCMYYNATNYAGTNFESAGVGIVKRSDLAKKNTCTTAEPDGYTNLTPEVRTESGYVTSVFAPLGDGAAGHYATDRLYRLSLGTTCYEIRQRIGETQFANYPAGTKIEFSPSDAANVQALLDSVLNSIMLPNGEHVMFPVVSARAAQ